jgi:amidase
VTAEHSAAAAARLLSDGSASAVELAETYLARIERHNPALNAVLALAPDALEAARASDGRRAAGALLGPLDGIPVLVKDNIEAVGLPGTAGSRALLGSAPATDAPLVARLRAAGLVVLGATNLSEWANFRSTGSTSGWSAVGGQCRNPHDPERNTSGSSSGSGAAIAAGLAPLAVGTETDGSIVAPAGTCGLVGFKPTVGSIPGSGIVPISPRQDTAGPMTRTVADAAGLYGVLAAAGTSALPPADLAGRRIAWWQQDDLPVEVAQVMARVLDLLSDAGAEIVPALADQPSGPFAEQEFEALLVEFAVALPAYLAGRRGGHPRTWPELLAFNRADDVELSLFSDEIFQRCPAALEAGGLTAPSYLHARAACDAAAGAALAGLLDGCDFALAPTNAPAAPIRYGASEDTSLSTSSLCAVTGAPSITLPARVDGLPVGVSLLGRRDADLALLRYAEAVERLLPRSDFALP